MYPVHHLYLAWRGLMRSRTHYTLLLLIDQAGRVRYESAANSCSILYCQVSLACWSVCLTVSEGPAQDKVHLVQLSCPARLSHLASLWQYSAS